MNVLPLYPGLKEALTSDPDERTHLNIDNSDGTLIIVPSMPLPKSITDGTKLTIEYAKEKEKPYLIICLKEQKPYTSEIIDWIKTNDIRILNVGGPREANAPGIHQQTREFLRDIFSSLQLSQRQCKL